MLPNKYVWKDILPKYPLLYDWNNEDDFIRVVENALDNKDKIYDNAQKEMQSVVKNMTWRKQVRNWLDWKEFFNPETFQMVGKDIATYKKVLAIIKRRKRVSKMQLIGELNWGRQFKFGRYRNRLRLDDRIKFTQNGYEWK